jgi:DHA1 family bicyclomycin/chloramphenicol resistance-like MFS transporter
VRDLYTGPRAGRELSLMGSIMALAPVVAPMIGGLLHSAFGWRANFLGSFGVGVLAALLVWRKLPETLRRRSPEPFSAAYIATTYRSLAGHGGFVAHLGIVALSYAGLFAWLSGSSFVLQDLYGLSPFGFGFAFAFCGVGFFIGATIAARLVTRLGLDRTIGLGAMTLAAGGLAMVANVAAGSTWVIGLVLPMVVYLAGLGLAMPQAMAGALTPFPDRAGAASSLLGFCQQIFAAAFGILVGQLIGQSAWPLAAPIAAAGCGVLLIWVASRRVRSQATAPSH